MNKNRHLYIDNVRLWVIFFVVLQHIAVTYSGQGDWYYIENSLDQIGIVEAIIFLFGQAVTQGYTMGLLFLIAGYFVPGSYDKKGFGKFIKDRLFRLGIPTLIYMLIIQPFMVFGVLGYRYEGSGLWTSYSQYITTFRFIGESGPLWFAFALLVFSIIYALFSKLTPPKANTSDHTFPSIPKIIVLILLISLCTFFVRIVQPVGTNILNMQLCHFSQYVIMFIVGIKCKRAGWLEKLDYSFGKRWLFWSLPLGFVLFLVVLISGGALDGTIAQFEGGITWQSAAYSTWESFIAVSMSICLIALFKEKYNNQNSLIKTMSRNAFSVYVFHAPVIVALTMLFAPVTLIPIVKFIIMGLIGIPVCFLVTNFTIQKVPLLRKIFA